MNTFKVGDKVMWSSQAAGSYKTKTGIVVEAVKAGKLPTVPGMSHGMSRKHDSYVVHVEGKTPQAKGKSYWPVVSLLKAVP